MPFETKYGLAKFNRIKKGKITKRNHFFGTECLKLTFIAKCYQSNCMYADLIN